jgi:hypothetical protein
MATAECPTGAVPDPDTRPIFFFDIDNCVCICIAGIITCIFSDPRLIWRHAQLYTRGQEPRRVERSDED